jgi:cytochrome c oxidase subunit 2
MLASLLQGQQSALAPRGPVAAEIAQTAWVLFAGAAALFALVLALALYAVFARRERAERLPQRALIVGGGIVLPVVVLSALLLWTLLRFAELPPASASEQALAIRVTGEQWWWRVDYLDAQGRRDFATANEIHIPAGRTIDLRLESADVLHSFWVPALAGKLDMIPGRTNRLRIRADAPGEFRGQCAEYCGGPHALMALHVVASDPEVFERWVAAQRAPGRVPDDPLLEQGRALLLAHCAVCHKLRGTAAAGERGPDLTHFGSRRSIGAGLAPVNAGTIAAWIASGQHLKPGNLMPEFAAFSGAELHALAAYLESLQ